QIAMYKRCPQQYYFRYVEGKKIPPKSQRILGTGVHTGLEEGFREKKLSGGNDVKIRKIMEDKAVETIEMIVKTEQEIDWGEDNLDKIKDDGAKMCRVYYTEKGKKIKPEDVEKEFEIVLNGVDLKLKGKIDLTTKKKIIDYKTGAQKPADEWIFYDDQLKIYRLVTPLQTEAHWIIRYKTKDPQIFVYQYQPSEQEIQKVLQDVIIVSKLIRTGYFYRKNDIKICSWCGYKDICQNK
ncbi:MAG: PD-(D/E)XK nuclease family protein, partial [Elusimicrobiota bacterium]|nr:PD-(D/E)XK nuclease family protein [Elusimicrobiota bacterium]